MSAKKVKASRAVIVKAVYAYGMLALGVLLLLAGLAGGLRVLIYSSTFSAYPLPGEGYLCEPPRYLLDSGPESYPEKVNEDCEVQLEKERALRKTDDIVYALTSSLAGIVVLVPHVMLARNLNKES